MCNTQRPDRAGDEGLLACGFTGQADTGLIDRLQLLGESERRKADAVAAEGVGFKDLGARLDVFLVNFLYQLRRREIQLVEAAVDEHALAVEHGAHCAVGHDDARFKQATKLNGTGHS